MKMRENVKFGPFRVSQVARFLGCSETWLRRAEQSGKIPKAKRDINTWRYYTMEDIAVLQAALLPESEELADTSENSG